MITYKIKHNNICKRRILCDYLIIVYNHDNKQFVIFFSNSNTILIKKKQINFTFKRLWIYHKLYCNSINVYTLLFNTNVLIKNSISCIAYGHAVLLEIKEFHKIWINRIVGNEWKYRNLFESPTSLSLGYRAV